MLLLLMNREWNQISANQKCEKVEAEAEEEGERHRSSPLLCSQCACNSNFFPYSTVYIRYCDI